MKRIVLVALVVMLFLALPAAVPAQEDDTNWCNPVARSLAAEMGVECQALLAYQGQGIGLGQIMRAWYLAQSLPDYGGDWQTLLQQHQDGFGWGQIVKADRLARLSGRSSEELLALKASGLGWGRIMQASAIAAAGIGLTFDEAIALLQGGAGWGEIRQQLDLPPGPPPWAGGGPPWAGRGNGRGRGRPPWAGDGNG